MSDNYQESVVFTNLVIDPGRGSTRQDRVPGIAVDSDILSVGKGLEKFTHAYEGWGTGGAEPDRPAPDPQTIIVTQPKSITDALQHMRQLRSEKAILRDVGGPIERLDQLKTESEVLEKQLKQLYEGRDATLQLCLNSETITEEERNRLQSLAVLENRDLMMLEGVELNDCFKAVKSKLESLENDEGVKALMSMLDKQELQKFDEKYSNEKFNLLKAQLEKTATAGPTQEEVPRPISNIDNLADLSTRFAKLDERLHQIEQVVGMDVVEAMSFPFQDIPTAICHLTERMLLLDPRKLDAIHERASDLSKELDKLLSTKAHVVFGSEGPSLQALTSEKKIETLYVIATRWKSTANSLPKLVQKLKYLSVLSRDTADLQTRLDAVETDVGDVKSLLESSQKSLEVLNSRVTEQIDLMSQILDKLNKKAFE
eukprot:Gregarina_sp_Pseudo_9__2816@NODE_304_length_3212_cov_18_570123_g285_i0_p1_GENE_NODE_304_length_3212_cov_18_570123_g285_i0NODE_304_length_3212_cov_18_570123_g285_i0_p1_ORF_typecomplete_len428_score85_23Dynamitin/PF04912_14/3_8e30TolA_bind_tri/PF16331_5/0_42TolA_bind_tri/PF16331_5/1_6e02TolA_bind_tri/PF16331_5/3_6e02TolA_bind_tri/PF16331_5/0_19Dynactin_p22/PF07426_11/3_3e02Dynactin_p22/PF07426_11/1_2e03Dynactin_p22/PF07426_11/0_00023Sec8_exocyst/PF04048_14/5e02Sec8_exocyst/PF04048_14/4e02Sec8_exoc